MLTTKSPSIAFSTPVSPPIDSTSHIWCTRPPSAGSWRRTGIRGPARPARPAASGAAASRTASGSARTSRAAPAGQRRRRTGGRRAGSGSVTGSIGTPRSRRSGDRPSAGRRAARPGRCLRDRGRSVAGGRRPRGSRDLRIVQRPGVGLGRKLHRRRARDRLAVAGEVDDEVAAVLGRAAAQGSRTRSSPPGSERVPAPVQAVGQRDLAACRRRSGGRQ